MENKMNQSKQKRILLRAVIIVVCLAGYIMLVRVLNSVEKTEMVSMKGYSYQKAVVTEVVRDNLTEDGQRAGYQYLKVKLPFSADTNLTKSPKIRCFLALIYLSLTSRQPSPTYPFRPN